MFSYYNKEMLRVNNKISLNIPEKEKETSESREEKLRKRGKKGKKKEKKPVENDVKGILAEGNSELKDGDAIMMPVVGPEDIPLPDNETDIEEAKLELHPMLEVGILFRLVENESSGTNKEIFPNKLTVTSETGTEMAKICWYCHAPNETTKLFKCQGCHQVSRFPVFLLFDPAPRRATVGASAKRRIGRGTRSTVLKSCRRGMAGRVTRRKKVLKFKVLQGRYQEPLYQENHSCVIFKKCCETFICE